MKAGAVMKSILLLCAILLCPGCASEKICDPPCQEWEECIDGTCTPPPCCPDAPADEIHISVSGRALDITTGQGVSVAVEPMLPDYPSPPPNPPPPVRSDENGNFETDCFNVTNVALGVLLMTDDYPPDNGDGAYFPAISGAAGWDTNVEKVCIYDAKVYTVPNTLVAALDADTSVDSHNYGFVIGRVVDSSGDPVAGAVITKGDGTNLVEVIYPDASLTTFDGTVTSESGIFVLPHTNFAGGITEVVAEKDGMPFGAEKAAPKAGCTYVVYILGY